MEKSKYRHLEKGDCFTAAINADELAKSIYPDQTAPAGFRSESALFAYA